MERSQPIGVFDSGVNALSILTTILPETVFVEAATLFVPVNCDSPIVPALQRIWTLVCPAILAATGLRPLSAQPR